MDENNIVQYRRHLVEEEKSAATVQKYLHDIRVFFEYIGTQPISKENTIAYKEYLCEKLAAVSVNSMLAALNDYLRFLGRLDCCVKPLKIQRRIFCDEEKELTRTEYLRLLQAAKNKKISACRWSYKRFAEPASALANCGLSPWRPSRRARRWSAAKIRRGLFSYPRPYESY